MNTYYEPTFLGTIACYYYLSHKTVYHFSETLKRDSSLADLIEIMCFSTEYAIFPVRHNEDKTNQELTRALEFKTNIPMDSPHLKVMLLIYSYLSDIELPTREYMVDTKTVLDQALRILQGMLDIVTNSGWLSCSLKMIHLLQMILQGQWIDDSCLTMLPQVKKDDVPLLYSALIERFAKHTHITLATLKQLYSENPAKFKEIFAGISGSRDIEKFLTGLPIITISVKTAEVESPNALQTISLTDGRMYSFTADSSVEFKFQLNRRGKNTLEVHSNKFMKTKEESWILVIGLPEEDVLLASKKLSFKKQKIVNVKLKMPSQKGLSALLFVDKKIPISFLQVITCCVFIY